MLRLKFNYHTYSHVSREILDKIWTKLYQFDLYAGHKNYRPKCTITVSCTFKNLLLTKMKLLNFQILDTFCHIFFNLTYTRVDLHPSIYDKFCQNCLIFSQTSLAPKKLSYSVCAKKLCANVDETDSRFVQTHFS